MAPDGWREHERKHRTRELADARRRFWRVAKALDALEDEGIVRGRMWEHANRQFWAAGRKLSVLDKKLYDWERLFGNGRNERDGNGAS